MLPAPVASLLERLHAAGHKAYVVGGCVRDSLRGAVPADWDITTSARPEEVLHIFADRPVYTVGQRHGTIAVGCEERYVEVTTFRTEGQYTDRRRPDKICFVNDVTEDLARRDFTVNAMAWNAQEGLIDPFGGQCDLQNCTLRCVGDPDKRFGEDALRILRGLRFAATLGFSLERNTSDAIFRCKALLHDISAERIADECSRLLCGDHAADILNTYRDVIAVVLPELVPTFDFDQKNPHHRYDVYTHSLQTLQHVPAERVLRWAALLHDIGKPACFVTDENGVGHFPDHAAVGAPIAQAVMQRLKFDSDSARKVEQLVRLHGQPILPDEPVLKRLLGKIGEEQVRRLIALQIADTLALAPAFFGRVSVSEQAETMLDEIVKSSDCFSLKDLAVKGYDLIAAGMAPGPVIGTTLQQLLEDVITGRCPNEREALLGRIREMKKEEGL